MIEDLSVDCGNIRVRIPYAIPPPKPSPLFILGLASIFGLAFALLNKEKNISITTGKLGGKIVYINK